MVMPTRPALHVEAISLLASRERVLRPAIERDFPGLPIHVVAEQGDELIYWHSAESAARFAAGEKLLGIGFDNIGGQPPQTRGCIER